MKNTLEKIPAVLLRKKLNSQCRRFLTLLELLIVIGILALISTVVVFNIGKLFQQQRFWTSVEQVIDRLQMAQNLMLILKTEVTVAIQKNDQGKYEISMEVETPLPKLLEENAIRHIVLGGIEEITFDRGNGAERLESIQLSFSNLYKRTPEGVLMLRQNQDRQEFIRLYGYSQPILLGNTNGDIEISPNESSRLYPQEVREELQEGLLESNQQKKK